MPKTSLRHLGSQLTTAVLGALVAIALTGGGFAFAQEAPESGVGVAEALAGPNTVNSAAIVNGAVTGQDIAPTTIGRGDLKVGLAPLWARVRSDGTIIASKGVTGASVISGPPGAYQIDFSRAITGCAWIGTATDNDASGATEGYVTVERRQSNDSDSLEVRTFDNTGSQVARAASDGFTVMVAC